MLSIDIDIDDAYKIMSELILSDIELYRDELGDITMLDFLKMPPNGHEDIVSSMEHLAVLEMVAPFYCGKDWQSKI